MDKVVKTFDKNKFQEVRASISEYRGIDLVTLRIWTLPRGATEKVPTAKGISINVKLFPHLKEAVFLLEEELKKNNMLS
ncbi:MAG: transcriptional coactivator p15/PC4 family protein [Candidatus Omnitrophota bacterium]